jgi:hypothetical protein
MGVRGVVRDVVDDHAHPAPVRLGDQRVEVVHVAEARVDRGVVGDVVAAVAPRRDEERRHPDRVDAERVA